MAVDYSSGPAPSCFNTTRVTYHPEGGGESSLQLRDPAANDTILTGLQCNTRYTITVVATAGEYRRESAAMTVFLPLLGMTSTCTSTLTMEIIVVSIMHCRSTESLSSCAVPYLSVFDMGGSL